MRANGTGGPAAPGSSDPGGRGRGGRTPERLKAAAKAPAEAEAAVRQRRQERRERSGTGHLGLGGPAPSRGNQRALRRRTTATPIRGPQLPKAAEIEGTPSPGQRSAAPRAYARRRDEAPGRRGGEAARCTSCARPGCRRLLTLDEQAADINRRPRHRDEAALWSFGSVGPKPPLAEGSLLRLGASSRRARDQAGSPSDHCRARRPCRVPLVFEFIVASTKARAIDWRRKTVPLKPRYSLSGPPGWEHRP
jgi:hypothetical protein